MGLKAAGLRGSLRNVSVGASVIPDGAIYYEGELEGDWIEAYTVNGGLLEKRETTLYANAVSSSSFAQAVWATSKTYDLTNYSAIEYVFDGSLATSFADFAAGVDSSTTDQIINNYDTNQSLATGPNTFTDETRQLDVSGISGSFFVGFAAWDASSGGSNEADIEVSSVRLVS